MPDNRRRGLFGNSYRRPSAGEMIVGAALDHLTRGPKREPNVPLDPTLPVELQGIIESSDFIISRSGRGQPTNCWIWQPNRIRIKDPISGRSKEVAEIVYRAYSGKEIPSDKALLHKCGQDRCINYEHFSIIRQREVDPIHRIRTRSDVEIREGELNIIRKLAERYDWTEKEQGHIFNVTIIDLRYDSRNFDARVDRILATIPQPDPDDPDIIELDIPPEPDRPLPEPETPPETETPPEPETPPSQSVPAARKSKTTAALLAFLLGGFGAHKFYLGYTGTGLIHLCMTLTVIGALVNVPVCIIEFLIYLSKSDEECHQTYVVNRKRFF